MSTWRQELDGWRAWARAGSIIDPHDARRVDAFYEALATHCGRGGSLDDNMPGPTLKAADVRNASHVTVDGSIERVISRWGVDERGHLAPPSQGGFGVVTISGRRVGMFEASAYWSDGF
jgi:hypothetical protein